MILGTLATIVLTATAPIDSVPPPADTTYAHEIQEVPFTGIIKYDGLKLDYLPQLFEMRDSLLARGCDLSQVNELFSHDSLRIDERVGRKLKSNTLKKADNGKMTEEELFEKAGVPYLQKMATKFFTKYKNELNDVYHKYKVDPRVIAAILGIETQFGHDDFRGDYVWPNTFLSIYTLSESDYWENFALDNMTALFEYAKIKDISIDELFKEKSSYTGAYGFGQFQPPSLVDLFRGKNGDLASADPWNMVDNLWSIGYYLTHNGQTFLDGAESGHWKPKGSIDDNYWPIFSYNHSDSYVKIIKAVAKSIKWSPQK